MPRYKKHSSDVFIDARNIHRLLKKNIKGNRTRSVSNPNEKVSGQYNPGPIKESTQEAMLTRIEARAVDGDIVDKAAYLMYYNGMRVRELLNIDCREIGKDGTFKIKALKGSINRIGYPGMIFTWLSGQAGKPRYLIDHFNYRTLYYQFQKRGLMLNIPGNEHTAVTHAMRHLQALKLQREGYDKEAIQHKLGHRSGRSTDYYTAE